jgi:ATP-dependent Clp protease ATP-binding subunit ClpA
MFENYTPDARAALQSTVRYATGLGHNYVGTEHLLLALVGSEESAGAGHLVSRGITVAAVETQVRFYLDHRYVSDAEALRRVASTPKRWLTPPLASALRFASGA